MPAISDIAGETRALVVSDDSPGWTHRTEADLTSLLIEISRAMRGLAFYGEADPSRAPFIDRAFDAIDAERRRAGAIELRREAGAFAFAGLPYQVPTTGLVQELAAAFEKHDVERIRFDESIARSSIHALLDLLSHPAHRYDSPGHFAKALAARDASGIVVNDHESDASVEEKPLTATSPYASTPYGSPRPAPETGLDAADSLERVSVDSQEDAEDEETPRLDRDPLGYPAANDRGERLRARLIELDATFDDSKYGQQAADIVRWAEDLGKDGMREDAYRTLLVFADHAVGIGGRSEVQARSAAACLKELVQAKQLDDLIERACGLHATSSVRAAQILLQLGPPMIKPIFDRVCENDDQERAAALRGLIVMLGEQCLPTLSAAIQGDDEQRARIAIRIAGELQSTVALKVLIRASTAPSLARRLESIRALSLLPGEESKAALESALDSEVDEIVNAATGALATTEGSLAIPTLLDVLEASLDTTRTAVCVSLIGVLSRIGDERVVPRLSSILERRPLLRRPHWHSVQLAAVEGLAHLPSKEAQRSIERAALNAVRPVRLKALTMLEQTV